MLGGEKDPRSGGKEELKQQTWRNFGETETWRSISKGNGEHKKSSLIRGIYAHQQNKLISQDSKNPGAQCEELHLELGGN